MIPYFLRFSASFWAALVISRGMWYAVFISGVHPNTSKERQRPRQLMMAQLIDRKQLKREMKDLLRSAQVSPLKMVSLYLGLVLVLNLADSFTGLMTGGIVSTFISILTQLMGMVLSAGFVLYCMAIRRGERAEYLTLFDGFSFVGKVLLLNVLIYIFTFLWGLLFVIPGIIAGYRYRFALYNLYENPGINVMEALEMSKQQTLGYKGQLFLLDLSYIGWSLLASLPSMAESLYRYSLVLQDPGYFLADPLRVSAITLPLPVGLRVFLWLVWPLLLAVFYLPVYQCTELGYFDTAKHTSGVGAGAGRPESIWDGF